MIFSTSWSVIKRLRSRAVCAVCLGLAAMVALVSCGPLAGGFTELTERSTEDSAQSREAPMPARVLVRKFRPRYETGVSLPQYLQADEYMRIMAPAEMRAPLLLATRYAQTEHMPILLPGKEGDLSSRQFTDWGFLAFAADFNAHIRILEGRPAEPALPGDTPIEAIMTTEKLATIGARVGDTLTLVHRLPGNGLVPIEVKIVGRWSPQDPAEVYWFYDSGYFSEALMVAEATYVDVLLPGWKEIGYEYSWYAVYDVDEGNSINIDSGIDQIRTNLADIIGDVEIVVMPHDNAPRGGQQSTNQ